MIHIDVKYIHLISPRLERFKKVRDYLYNFRCPYCGDSQKQLNKARGYFYRKEAQMNYMCHNCQKSTTASKVIEYLDTDTYKEYVMERYVGTDDEPTYNFEAPKFEKKDPKLKDLIPINKLEIAHPALQILIDREIPIKHYEQFYLCHKFCAWADINSNKDHPRLVIPFRDEKGEVFAAQGRAFGNEQPKYLTVKFDDRPKIFGLDRLDFTKSISVVEGPIDSLFLENAIAVAGLDMLQVVNHFDKDQLVMILDNERRSRTTVEKMESLIDNDYQICIWPDTISQKDVNDMILAGLSSAELQAIIKQNTFAGLQAKVRLAEWHRI